MHSNHQDGAATMRNAIAPNLLGLALPLVFPGAASQR
jgi:hypothetical protein